MGSQKLSGAHICCFPDFALQYIMTRYTGVFSSEYLYPKGFLSLIEHDKNSSTNYIKTLDVYLKNEMKISDTANELFLHRSSLLSRLGRIGKILDVDIKDPEVRLFLRVCLYLFHQAARG
jgi:sugar diacid utilization regulator